MRLQDVVLQPGAYDQDKVSKDTGLECLDESLAVQADAIDADINTIVRRFGIGETLPTGMVFPTWEDFAEVFDFQSAMNVVRQGEEAFNAMPWHVRERFGHSPQRFLEFCLETGSDGKLTNVEEMRKLGLAIPAKVEEKVDGPVPEPK